jgi:Carboxypeptidase regulatory-like domain
LSCIFILFVLFWPLAIAVPLHQADKKSSTGFGSIQGRVLDSDGKPVPAAEVFAQSRDRGSSDILHVVTSNANGEFLLTQVPSGKNAIFTSKPADGYPDTMVAAFSSGVNLIPEVLVEEAKTTSGVVIYLTKGATLVGSVVNLNNGLPVIGARILISRDDDPQLFLSTRADVKGRFQFTIPAKAFNIQVSEPGYATWENGETAPHAKGPPILLSAGMYRKLLIRLEKLKGSVEDQEKSKQQ